MSLAGLDPVLNQPKRLAALGILANSRDAEFSFLRDHLGLRDSDLSKQMSALVEHGYVSSHKMGVGKHRSTWFTATEQGRAALARHVEALESLVNPVLR